MGNCQPGQSTGSPVDDGELHARGPSDFYARSAPSAPQRSGDGSAERASGSGSRAQREAREKLREWKERHGEAQDPPNMATWGQAIDDPLVKMLVDSMPSNLVGTPTRGGGAPPEDGGGSPGSHHGVTLWRPYTFGVGAPQEDGASWDSERDREEDDPVPAASADRPDAISPDAEGRDEDLVLAASADGLDTTSLAAEDLEYADRTAAADGLAAAAAPEAGVAAPVEPRELTDTYSYAGAGVGLREEAGGRPQPPAGRSGGAAAPAPERLRRTTDPWVGRPQRDDFADLPVQPSSAPPMAMARAPRPPDSGAGGGGPVPFANVMEAKLKAKEWQFQLKMEMKMIEREIKKVRKDQDKLQKELNQKAATGRTAEVERLARSVVTVRRTVERLERAKGSMKTVELELSQAVVVASVRHSLQVSAGVMREMNSIAHGHGEGSAIEVMRREMAQCAGAEDAVEAALYEEDDEEVALEVQRVLEEAELERIRLLEGALGPPASAPAARPPGRSSGVRARAA